MKKTFQRWKLKFIFKNQETSTKKSKQQLTVGGVRVVLPADSAPPEDHFVLGESPGFVAEHELDLTEVLGNVERPANHGRVALAVVQVHVVVDHVDLRPLDQLDAHVQRDGDEDLLVCGGGAVLVTELSFRFFFTFLFPVFPFFNVLIFLVKFFLMIFIIFLLFEFKFYFLFLLLRFRIFFFSDLHIFKLFYIAFLLLNFLILRFFSDSHYFLSFF